MNIDTEVEMWKIKKIIKSLSEARGNGTSMITLIIPTKGQINLVNKMLTDEYGTATNIKSRVNRLSVLSAITTTQQKLKLYNKTPPNGLVIFSGTMMTTEGKEKRVNIDFEPFKPITKSLYLCDNKFHTEPLKELLDDNESFGFIIIDGNGCLYATLQGNSRNILHKFTVDLPKKHKKGGQSAQRFGRIRLEKRLQYVKKCSELTTQYFISDNICNVKGIIIAGSAEFKEDLANADFFDQRLQKHVLKIVDISYGMENGFNAAIELSSDTLSNVKLIHEKKILQKFYEEIAQDTGKYSFMIKDTMLALEMSAIETLIIWEELEINRIILKNPSTNEETILFLSEKEEKNEKYFYDKENNIKLEIKDKVNFVEWIAENYKTFGANLELITDRSQEGSQFCKGFGGVGSILRWKVDFDEMNEEVILNDNNIDDYSDDDYI